MATLTIKANDLGGLASLQRLVTLQETSVKTTEKLSAIAGTIKGHWQQIGDTVRLVNQQLSSARLETERIAAASKAAGGGFLTAASAAAKMAAELSRAQAAAIATARVANSIRPGGGGAGFGSFTGPGSGGFSFTPTAPRFSPTPATYPPRGPSTSNSTRQSLGSAFGAGFGALSGGFGSAVSGAASAVGNVGSAVFGGGMSGAAAAVGGLATGGVTAAVGLLSTGVSTAFKIGVGILEAGIKTAVNVLETGLKGAMLAGAAILGNSVRLAVKQEPIQQSFGAIAGAKGLDQADTLERLRSATKGTVSDLELMKTANYAMQLGAARSTEELEKMANAAFVLAKAVGRDTTDAFNDMALGVGRQSRLILDNLGLIVDEEAAYKDYAKSVNSSVEALTEQEKKLVFNTKAMEAADAAVANLGKSQATAGDSLGRFGASFTNLSAALGKTFLPVLSKAADNWSKFIDGMQPGELQAKIGAGFDWLGDKLGGIFGANASTSASGLGSAIFSAITEPSAQAFQILGIRAEQFVADLGDLFKKLWNDFRGWASQALIDTIASFSKFITATPFGPLRRLAGAKDDGIDAIAASAKAPMAALNAGQNLAVDATATNRNRAFNERIAAFGMSGATSGGGGGGSPFMGGGSSGMRISAGRSNEAMAAATASGNAIRAAEKAEQEARRLQLEAMRKEIDGREDLAREFEKDITTRTRAMEMLGSGAENAAAAMLELRDPTKTVAERLNALATDLRQIPESIKKATEEIEKVERDRIEVLARNAKEEQKLREEMTKGLRDTVQEFLQSGPQDFESVRVRSMKRRAQKERARGNADLVNAAVGSASFDNIGGSLGGFGTQGVERTPRVFGNRFPGLEAALAQSRDERGGTMIQEMTAKVNELVAEHVAKAAEVNAKLAEATAKKLELEEKRNALQEETNALIEKEVDITGTLIRRVAESQATVAKLNAAIEKMKADMEAIARKAKK